MNRPHTLSGEGGRVGPALDGAAARLRPEYLRRIVAAPGRAAPGSIMPAPLEDNATTELITRYLHGRATTDHADGYLSRAGDGRGETASAMKDLTAGRKNPKIAHPR